MMRVRFANIDGFITCAQTKSDMTTLLKSLDDYKNALARSTEDPEGFWADEASTFEWRKPWSKVLEWNFDEPDVKWFIDGKLNIRLINSNFFSFYTFFFY